MSGGYYDYIQWQDIVDNETIQTLIRVSQDMRKEGITGDILLGLEYTISHAAKALREKERIARVLHEWEWYKSCDISKEKALAEIAKYKFYPEDKEI